MASDLYQQGVEAFQAGDKARARMLLQEATSIDPNNENAWYYLAAAETDNIVRRQYLERVLQINPNHARAREVLNKLDSLDAAGGVAVPASTPPQPRVPTPPSPVPTPPPVAPVSTPIRPLDPDAGTIPGADSSGGFLFPISIPGAPPQVSLNSLFSGGWMLFQRGLDVLQRKPGVYEAEVGRATWWRFWLLVGFGYVINTIFTTVSALLFGFNLLAAVLTLILTVPMGLITLYAGVYVSHWWAKRQGGQLPLYQHAYAVALPYIPAWILGTLVELVLSLIGLSLGWISLIVSIYALYVMALGFENLYRFSDPNQKYFTVAAMFVGVLVAGFIVGRIVAAIFGVGMIGAF